MSPINSNSPRWLRIGIAIAALVLIVADVSTVVARHHNGSSTSNAGQGHPRPTITTLPTTPPPTRTSTPPVHKTRHPVTTGPTAISPPSSPTSIPTITISPSPPVTPTTPGGPTSPPNPPPTSSPSPSPPPHGGLVLPPTGTYSYSTSGSEGTGSSSSSFPASSHIVVTSSGCGIKETWKPNANHTESRELCLTGDHVRLAAFSFKVTSANATIAEAFTCASNAIIYSPGRPLGTTKHFTCTSSDSAAKLAVTPVGFETLKAGATSVKTLHVAIITTFGGKSAGMSSQQLYFQTKNSVLIRNSAKVNVTVGGVRYHESYTLRLDSLEPTDYTQN